MYNKIIENDLFKKYMNTIENNERDRIFCKHGIVHCLDVARIAYILSLENGLNIPKDIIYASSLLHDIGRAFNSREHNNKSAEIAQDILEECGYSMESIAEIKTAIENHRQCTNNIETLSDIISKADKLSRQCYDCKAQKECYWSEERKNSTIVY